MSGFNNLSYSNMVIHEGLNDIPTITVTLKDNVQYGYPDKIYEFDLEGYKGYLDKIFDKELYLKAVDPNVFLKFESKYLGNSLRSALKSLNLKSQVIGDFTDINQDFYMINETPWKAFLRLSKYLPQGYYAACLADKIIVFSSKGRDFKELKVSTYITQSDFSTEYSNLITQLSTDKSSSKNPKYGTLIRIPTSKLMLKDIINSSGNSVINNYLANYRNRDSYFPQGMLFQYHGLIEIGEAINVDGANLIVISRSIAYDISGNINGAYRCMKVD